MKSHTEVRARISRRALGSALAGVGLATIVRPTRAQESASSEQLSGVARNAIAELAAWAKSERAELTARVCDAQTDRELASAAAHLPLNPASNQKLLTMAVALERMGPDYRFSTSLHGRGSGDALSELVLRSNGDPTLSLEDLAQLARELAAQGCRRINGDLWVDQSAFDRQWDPPAYEKHPEEWATYRAPVSAVAVDRNTISLHVAATAQGSPARVWVTPDGQTTLSGSVATGASGRAHDVRLSVRRRGNALELLLGGTIPSNLGPLAFGRRIADPEVAAGRALLGLLRERQVALAGSVRSGGAEIQAEKASVRSRSLAEVLHALGKHSDNFVAEMLLKAVGAFASGATGSSAGGATVIEEYLSRHAALDQGTLLRNGSGLYDANRVSAYTFTRVLSAVANDPRVYPEFLASLSIGGLDGTLSQRFRTLRNARTLRAKTGTLAGVTALSGYVLRAAPNGPLAFSVLLNGVADKLAEGRQRIDRAIESIARVA